MTERQKKILDLLMEQEFLTAQQIGEQLHISDRTVRSEIKEINSEQKEELIRSKKGQGYCIAQKTPRHQAKAEEGLENQADLEWKLIRKILFEEELSYLDLADQLYISDTLLAKIIRRVNRRMGQRYTGGSIRKQNGCLVMEMTEREKRDYYAIYVTTKNIGQFFEPDHFQPYFEYVDMSWIQQLILEETRNSPVSFFDATVMRLIVRAAVMAERMAEGYYVTDTQQPGAAEGLLDRQKERTASSLKEKERKEERKQEKEQEENAFQKDEAVIRVVERMGEYLGILVPEEEYAYFQSLFRNDFYYMKGMDSSLAEEILQTILIELNVEYGFDFSGDKEFCREMMAQLIGTLKRTQNRQLAVNPVLHRIKAQYPVEYDMAIFFAGRFQRLTGYAIGEDEVGLFAIHMIRAMETAMRENEKKVALINPFGKPIKELIKKRLREMGECQMKIVETYSIFDLPSAFPKDILAVLTTVPLPKEPEDVPVILCRNFLDYHEKEKLLTVLREEQATSVRSYFKKLFHPSLFFTDMEFGTKKEMLEFMCSQLNAQGYVDDGFLDSVMQREDIAPTAFETGFAIAHGMENMARRNAVCICIVRDWMAWGEYNVKIVFLFALASTWNHTMTPIYNVMIDNLMKANGVRKLSKARDCQSFVNALLS